MSDSTATPRAIEYLPLTELLPNPRNPKSHDLETIDESVGRFGYVEPIIRDDRTGFIVSGHGRTKTLRAMHERGESPPEGILVDEAGHWLVPVGVGWASRTDTEAAAALIALNRTTELGGWVDESLLELLDELEEVDDGLVGVGFAEDDLDALRARLEDMGEDSFEDEDEDGEGGGSGLSDSGHSFKDLDVLYGEPEHKVHHGQTYRLGGRHLLVVAKLAREHHLWSHLLDGRVFAPYPDVYLLLGTTPKTEEFLLVQPNHYLAGHILDKWTSVHGEESLELLDAAEALDGGLRVS